MKQKKHPAGSVKKIIAFAAGIVIHSIAYGQCDIDANLIGARYQITQEPVSSSLTNTSNKNTRTGTKSMNLWRRGLEVAHEFPDAGVTEIWNRIIDGRIRPVRYFDLDQRGIEYQPEDINKGKGDRDWNGKFQLISDDQFAAMTLVSTQGMGCDVEELYRFNNNGLETELTWLPELKLVKSYAEEKPDHRTKWVLLEVIQDKQKISQSFDSRSGYQLTDYADIGDSEDDPFMRKLIHLGFVSHEASGFYDEHGQPLEGGHLH